jgi:hypothetical protein
MVDAGKFLIFTVHEIAIAAELAITAGAGEEFSIALYVVLIVYSISSHFDGYLHPFRHLVTMVSTSLVLFTQTSNLA